MSEISKLITKYIEEFVLSCDKENKNDIMKDFKSKENKKKLDDFIASNNIKKKKNKSDKDEDKPKKPLTPYFLYVKEMRNDVKIDSGITDNLEITKELSKRWNILKASDSDDFKRYNNISEEHKKDYILKMQEYKHSHGIVEKPKTPFQHFKEENTQSLKSEFPDITKKDIHRKLQIKWKELQSEKCDTIKKYITLANTDKEKYDSNKNDEVVVEPEKEDEIIEEEEPPKIAIKKKKKDSVSSKKKVKESS